METWIELDQIRSKLDLLIIRLKPIEDMFIFDFITKCDFTDDVSTHYSIFRNHPSNQ